MRYYSETLRRTNWDLRVFPQGSKLAFDVNVSDRLIGRYARAGNIVVACALPAETDESFVGRAFAAGATHIFSQDADIGLIIDKEGYDGVVWVKFHK